MRYLIKKLLLIICMLFLSLWTIGLLWGAIGNLIKMDIPNILVGVVLAAIGAFFLFRTYNAYKKLVIKIKDEKSAIVTKKMFDDDLLYRIKLFLRHNNCINEKTLWTSDFIIAVSPSQNNVFIITRDKLDFSTRKYNYSDFVTSEISALTQKTKHNVKSGGGFISGIVGFAIAGPIGFMIGSKETSNFMFKEDVVGYEWKIISNNVSKPLYKVIFHSKEDADKWNALFIAIIRLGQQGFSFPLTDPPAQNAPQSPQPYPGIAPYKT